MSRGKKKRHFLAKQSCLTRSMLTFSSELTKPVCVQSAKFYCFFCLILKGRAREKRRIDSWKCFFFFQLLDILNIYF